MRRIALALLLASPLAARAQYLYPAPPPPPRGAPYGYPPPPPPVYVAPRPPPPSPFYVNLGVGYGAESWYAPQAYGGYLSSGGLAYQVEAGARLAPQLLLGFGLTGLSTFGTYPYGPDTGTTALNYDVVLTLFPFVRGFFLRGGGGLSTLGFSPAWGVSTTYVGSNVLLGAGWAFPISLPVHLTLGMDWSHQFYGAWDLDGLNLWMFRLGFGIY